MITPAEIVQAARGWLDTPYHHQARLRGVGVDCLGLLIGVCRELGTVDETFDVTGYPRAADGTTLMRLAKQHMEQIDGAMQPGHAIVTSCHGVPHHFGIIADYRHGGLSIIHASSFARPARVIEMRLLLTCSMQFVAAFKLPGAD